MNSKEIEALGLKCVDVQDGIVKSFRFPNGRVVFRDDRLFLVLNYVIDYLKRRGGVVF